MQESCPFHWRIQGMGGSNFFKMTGVFMKKLRFGLIIPKTNPPSQNPGSAPALTKPFLFYIIIPFMQAVSHMADHAVCHQVKGASRLFLFSKWERAFRDKSVMKSFQWCLQGSTKSQAWSLFTHLMCHSCYRYHSQTCDIFWMSEKVWEHIGVFGVFPFHNQVAFMLEFCVMRLYVTGRT